MWHSDPLVRGSYSYMSVEGEEMGVVPGALSFTPTTACLRFAGEATHPHHFSTVHGAIESGWREVDKILEEEGL